MTFETITYQVQFWAEIGQVDDGGMGHMQSVDERKAFATSDEAEQWLTDRGWVYSESALRRVKPGHDYGLARVRRVEEADRSKWIDDTCSKLCGFELSVLAALRDGTFNQSPVAGASFNAAVETLIERGYATASLHATPKGEKLLEGEGCL